MHSSASLLILVLSVAGRLCSAADADKLEADVQGCVRDHIAGMIKEGTYDHLAKLTSCVADGVAALHKGKAPPDVAKQIADCVNAKAFPDSLKDTVNDFLACVKAKLA